MWYSAVWHCVQWWLWWTETCGAVLNGVEVLCPSVHFHCMSVTIKTVA